MKLILYFLFFFVCCSVGFTKALPVAGLNGIHGLAFKKMGMDIAASYSPALVQRGANTVDPNVMPVNGLTFAVAGKRLGLQNKAAKLLYSTPDLPADLKQRVENADKAIDNCTPTECSLMQLKQYENELKTVENELKATPSAGPAITAN